MTEQIFLNVEIKDKGIIRRLQRKRKLLIKQYKVTKSKTLFLCFKMARVGRKDMSLAGQV